MKIRERFVIPRDKIECVQISTGESARDFGFYAGAKAKDRMEKCCECGRDFEIKNVYYSCKSGEGFFCPECIANVIVEFLKYGFWLRFISEHFVPCTLCQEKLDELLRSNDWEISPETMNVVLSIKKESAVFYLKWIDNCCYVPCSECQKKIINLIRNISRQDASNLHIGNKDYQPPIELWIDWVMDEEESERRSNEMRNNMKRLISIRELAKSQIEKAINI